MIKFTDLIDIIKAGKYDRWGIPIKTETIENKECKVMYSLKHEDMEVSDGKKIRIKARIYFDGLYDIDFDDKIIFVDEFGRKHDLDILDIKPIKNFQDVIEYTRVVV